MTTEKKEEYLESIYKIKEENKTLGTSELAKQLNLTPASVTQMTKKLEKDGLIEKKDKDISLTENGKEEALSVIRKHRLVEKLFVDVLGLNWEDVHEDACRVEHVLTDKITDALEKFLNHPKTCPHGNPIPHKIENKFALTEKKNLKQLSKLKPGCKGKVVKITEENTDFLKYLCCLGMVPEKEIEIEQVAPFNGPLLIKIADAKYAIGPDIAEKIWIKEASH